MFVTSATYSDSRLNLQQMSSAPAPAGSVAESSSAATVTVSAAAATRTGSGDSVAKASVVDLSSSSVNAGNVGKTVGAVQEEYNALATAEAAQKEVLAKVADIRAAVRQAAATTDSGTREALQKQVSSSLAEIEAAAGAVQAQTSSDSGGDSTDQAAESAAQQQASIANSINQQKMAAQAAVYRITSDSGSRTVRISTTDAAGQQLLQANTSLGDIGMHLRSLGGEVYFVPDFYRDSDLQQSLSQTMNSSEATQAFSQSGLSGRITINGRPYNLSGLSGLSPMQMASLAGVAAESGDLQEAVQKVSNGEDTEQVAREQQQEASSGQAAADPTDPASADDDAQAISGNEANESGASAFTGAAAEAAGGRDVVGLTDLAKIVQPDSEFNLTSNPEGALAVVDRVYAGLNAQNAGLNDQLEAYRQDAASRIDAVLTQQYGSAGEVRDAESAGRTTEQVARLLLQSDRLTGVDASGSRDAYAQLLGLSG